MHTLLRHIRTYSQCCLAVLAVAACRSGVGGEEPLPDTPAGFACRLTITTAAAPSTRGPQGGEDGDGRQYAWRRENKVTDATLLLYRGDKGVNSAVSTPIEQAFYADHLTATEDDVRHTITYTTDVMQSEERMADGQWHILILANLGDLTSWKGRTLGQLREAHTTHLFTQTDADDPSTATDFVMTSENDATVTLRGSSTEDNPNRITATIERLAARIDFAPGNTSGGSDLQTTPLTLMLSDDTPVTLDRYYRYDVADAVTGQVTESGGDVFLLTHVTPFNLLTSGEYLLKRVQDVDGQVSYLGDETADDNHQATNWVLDPWTEQKTGSTFPDGLTYDHPEATLDEETPLAVHAPDANNTDGTRSYYTLTYAAENTLFTNAPQANYATGLRLDGIYGKRNADGTYKYFRKQYTAYIRHADPLNAEAALPMKYGIVRNNIYRIYVNRFTQLSVSLIEVHPWQVIYVPRVDM